MRQLWTSDTKFDWDDPISETYAQEWKMFFDDLGEMQKMTTKRCIRPVDAVGQPILILFTLDEKMDLHYICTAQRCCKHIFAPEQTCSKRGKVHICYHIYTGLLCSKDMFAMPLRCANLM